MNGGSGTTVKAAAEAEEKPPPVAPPEKDDSDKAGPVAEKGCPTAKLAVLPPFGPPVATAQELSSPGTSSNAWKFGNGGEKNMHQGLLPGPRRGCFLDLQGTHY